MRSGLALARGRGRGLAREEVKADMEFEGFAVFQVGFFGV